MDAGHRTLVLLDSGTQAMCHGHDARIGSGSCEATGCRPHLVGKPQCTAESSKALVNCKDSATRCKVGTETAAFGNLRIGGWGLVSRRQSV